ncbi:MAG: T9SS type A sorting domain-containing protein [Bacteroidota bacterium]
MKKSHIILGTVIATLCSSPLKAQTVVSDSVAMGAGYGKAVYYNIRTGAESAVAMDKWHFSHTTVSRDNCIRVNHMGGVEVFAYPKGDNTRFSQFDTTGWASWTKYYNDIHVHEKGALNQSPNATNMWDFSWGVYDPTTKEVTGDSLYLFVITHPGVGTGKSFIKFMPIKQNPSGDFIFRTAMVDGTFDKTDTLLQSSAAGKSYKYYSFGVGDVYPEPNREEWDLLFTRYYALTTPPGGGTAVMYPTMGVESKRGTRVAKVTDYNWDMIATSPSQAIAGIKIPGTPSELNKDLTRIGGDWKAFNNATGRWTIQTNWNYVIESVRNITGRADTAYYMLSFTGFTGSSRGESQFRKLLLTPTASARTETKQIEVKLFPNPVQNNLMIWAPEFKALSKVNIVAADGRIVSQRTIDFSAETSVNLDVTGLAQGSYWLQINSDKDHVNLPFIKH